jgi:protein tyrosine phosphatase (PTP) superfamily phosphohydrolase (DUF442 family)
MKCLSFPLAVTALVVLVSGLAVRGHAEERLPAIHVAGAPIRHFREVVPGCVYCSGQPGDAGFQWLKDHGFRSVVCLRREHDDGREAVEKLGLNYLYLSLTDNDAPSRQQAEAFLRFAADAANWPLLVHCHHGLGRAPTMAALVRYSFEGWSMNRAMTETHHREFMGLVDRGLSRPQRRFLREWGEAHQAGAMQPHEWLALRSAR